jgi:hypothetical protein
MWHDGDAYKRATIFVIMNKKIVLPHNRAVMSDTQTPPIMIRVPKTKAPKTPSKAAKADKKPRAKRAKRVKVKTEPMPPLEYDPPTPVLTIVPDEIVTAPVVEIAPPPVPPPPRLPNGLRAAWEVEYKDEVAQVRYHSLRDLVYDLQGRGVDCSKAERMRAFLRRRSVKKTKIVGRRRRAPAWISTIKSIRRLCRDVPDYAASDGEAEGDGASDGMGDITGSQDESDYFSAH